MTVYRLLRYLRPICWVFGHARPMTPEEYDKALGVIVTSATNRFMSRPDNVISLERIQRLAGAFKNCYRQFFWCSRCGLKVGPILGENELRNWHYHYRAAAGGGGEDAVSKRVLGCDLYREGGGWLGAIRKWMQRKTRNGERVTWGSDQQIEPPMTVRQLEEAAAEVAAHVMNEQRAALDVAREALEAAFHEFRPCHSIGGGSELTCEQWKEYQQPDFVLCKSCRTKRQLRDAIARLKDRPNDGRSGRCGIRISGDSWCVLDVGHRGDHA